MLGGL